MIPCKTQPANLLGFSQPWQINHEKESYVRCKTLGVRCERIKNRRIENLTGRTGTDSIAQWIRSLGATYNPTKTMTVFAGVHRGFAPPRTEDVITGTGTSTEVGAELSTNWEVGLRAEPAAGTSVQATVFRNDFKRLIAVGSIAGGSTPLAQGEALFQGAELSGRLGRTSGVYLRGALTYLPTAEQRTPFRQVVNDAVVAGSAAGNRQPYAPKRTLTAAVGYAAGGFDTQFEAVYVSEQFGDFANTQAASTTGNGQTGRLAGFTVWNAALNYYLEPQRTALFMAIKNLGDKTYIVDRTRGIQVGVPRLIQAGIRYAF